MHKPVWREVVAFEGSSAPDWFREADRSLGGHARRFRADAGSYALVTSAPEHDSGGPTSLVGGSRVNGLILFVAPPNADDIAGLIDLVGGGPVWVAVPDAETTGDGGSSGGVLQLGAGSGPVVEYRLRQYVDDPSAGSRQHLSRGPRIGEGPTTIDDRAAWFEKRSGRG